MNIPSHNTLSIPAGNLHSTPSSTQTAGSVKGKEGRSKNAEGSGQPNEGIQHSGNDPELAKLKARDREVRAHEAAHAAAAGSLAKGGPSYTYQQGSDGRRYAVGGEVNIDTGGVSGDPEATIQKARQIRAAANAPANPSAQDRAVAAQASRLEAQARQDLQQERSEEIQDTALSAKFSFTPTAEPQIIDLFA
jgi:hypothetical protein